MSSTAVQPSYVTDCQGNEATRGRIKEFIKKWQQTHDQPLDFPFFLADLSNVKHQYKTWKDCFPRIEMFYAVKVSHELPVLTLLKDMGACFDCASQREMETILSLGVHGSRIIFANTIKSVSALKCASDNDVSLMTFDNEAELVKIKKYYPQAKLVIRIRCADSDNVIKSFGIKFGCSMKNIPRLLQTAMAMKLNVVGVSFHVGPGAKDHSNFITAVKDAYDVFQMGKASGFDFNLLDIGGGFVGSPRANSAFEMITKEVNRCLEQYFPGTSNVRLIAEPGRFMVASFATMVLQVIGKQCNENLEEGVVYDFFRERKVAPRFLYYVNDGIHGSIPFFLAYMAPIKPLKETEPSTPTYPSVVFGPTCSPCDVLYPDIALPELDVGDWLYLENSGAYSMVDASDFNMMDKARCFYLGSE